MIAQAEMDLKYRYARFFKSLWADSSRTRLTRVERKRKTEGMNPFLLLTENLAISFASSYQIEL